MNLPISSDTTYVALATTLLSPELRVHASAAGLCFLQVVDRAVQAKHLFVRVTALPHRLNDLHTSRVFTTTLCPEQLDHALVWDRTLQGLPTCEVRQLLQQQSQEHVAALTDTPIDPPDAENEPSEHTERVCDEPLAPRAHETITLLALPELFVSSQSVQEAAMAATKEPLSPGSSVCPNSWTRLVWLHAALAMVRRQMRHSCQAFARLDIMLEKVIAVQKRLRQSLVSTSAVYVGERLVGWRLQIAFPMRVKLA